MPKLVFVIHVCKKSLLIINQDFWQMVPHFVFMLRLITGSEVSAGFYKLNAGVCWTLKSVLAVTEKI